MPPAKPPSGWQRLRWEGTQHVRAKRPVPDFSGPLGAGAWVEDAWKHCPRGQGSRTGGELILVGSK